MLIDEWQKKSKTLRAYMKTGTHYSTLLPRQQKVWERVIFVANRDGTCEERIPQLSPSGSECAGINAPAFTILRELTLRGSLSLLGQMDPSLEVPRLGGVTATVEPPKRKAVADDAHPPATRQRTAWPFVSGMQHIHTPEGASHFAWWR